MRNHFVWFIFDKDFHNQCEYLSNNLLRNWRKIFNSPHFECNKHSMTRLGLIDHLYARALGKNGCIYHMATFYYLFEIYVGKEYVE